MKRRGIPGEGYRDLTGVIAAAGAPQLLAEENPDRRALLLQNLSATDLWLDFGVEAVQGRPSFRVGAGAFLRMEAPNFVDTGDVFIVGPTTGAPFAAREA